MGQFVWYWFWVLVLGQITDAQKNDGEENAASELIQHKVDFFQYDPKLIRQLGFIIKLRKQVISLESQITDI